MLVVLLGGGCAPARNFDGSLKEITRPYRFSMARWECQALSHELERWFSGGNKPVDGTGVVTEYFSLVARIKAAEQQIAALEGSTTKGDINLIKAEIEALEKKRHALREAVEPAIAEQVGAVLAEEGIYNPLCGAKFRFPPLRFEMEPPPHLLVVSPRERIESIRKVTLRQDMTVAQMEAIEAGVDRFGVSSLVVALGGFGGTYPAFVIDDASLRFTIDTATEEWLHQYLNFTPLGFRYLLDVTGIARDYEIATMNETVVGIISQEIGAKVCNSYYPQYEGEGSQEVTADSGFDFNREMREIRRAVNEYLARGEITPAEEFMEQKRRYLAANGYYLRKLNQAYFAFHGIYADKPTSINPIGRELKQLRSRTASLKGFLDRVSAMTSRQDLQRNLAEFGP